MFSVYFFLMALFGGGEKQRRPGAAGSNHACVCFALSSLFSCRPSQTKYNMLTKFKMNEEPTQYFGCILCKNSLYQCFPPIKISERREVRSLLLLLAPLFEKAIAKRHSSRNQPHSDVNKGADTSPSQLLAPPSDTLF